VVLPQQADEIPRPIDNGREQVDDVAAENAHVESIRVGSSGELTAENSEVSVFTP
jgi:hypothetical protein